MSSCGCGTACACIIRGGAGVTVTGAGTPTAPFVISASINDLSGSLTVRDSTTVDLTLLGSGTGADPFVLQAASSLKLTQLLDVADPSGGPSVGESPVWVGVGPAGHWEFGTLPPSPAGSVNTSAGISGLGTAPSPIALAAAAVWGAGELAGIGADSTIGLPVYVDSAGKVRAKPVTAAAVTWSSLTGKPTSFTPSPHTHAASDILDPTNLNVGRINGRKITTATSSASLPTAGTSPYDLVFFIKGT